MQFCPLSKLITRMLTTSVDECLSVDITWNSTESGRSRVQSQVAAGAKYRRFSSRRNPTFFRQKSVDQNLIMPTMEIS